MNDAVLLSVTMLISLTSVAYFEAHTPVAKEPPKETQRRETRKPPGAPDGHKHVVRTIYSDTFRINT